MVNQKNDPKLQKKLTFMAAGQLNESAELIFEDNVSY